MKEVHVKSGSALLTAESTPFAVTASTNPTAPALREQILAAPRFGTAFSDHMAAMTWTKTEGWEQRRIQPYQPYTLDPASAVLHYGQEIFEGLKAYRHPDGSVWAFRPQQNAARFARSARRLALPELSEGDFLASLRALVGIDKDWVPSASGSSLYLRPFMFASEAFLGVRSAATVEYGVIASPAGSYFASGFAPVSIWVAAEDHRAARGGTGAAKCGGNYAGSLSAQGKARDAGCDQVCFLDAVSNQYLEEIGSMNLMVVTASGEVITPALTGTILAGITRASVLELVADMGYRPVERELALAEVLSSIASGEITEVFACGTAAAITPIGRLAGEGFDQEINEGNVGELTQRLFNELQGIHEGSRPDQHQWMYQLA